ncbi:hypothetical protein [Hydrogenophaga laconesensis]|uniref:NAD(P)-binding domain-containing protein n=1 Tax=Hydrogenophaga laconesensis TaxID=1805971 RepID=A0ABU1V6V8_9BURK|nr:hypothetical protein [Hydrogenophaga laconesensis]MDR7093192.1 hypothetical protein [Hydrogenophaga laconesensis]
MRGAILAGAGGNLGSAALHALLGDARFDRVTVLTTCRFLQTPSRLAWAVVADGGWDHTLPAATHAVIVLGGRRRAREMVYWQPARDDLLPLATALRACGVQSLEVLLPPDDGLHQEERAALERLAFEPFSETRAATLPRVAPANAPWPERLALWLIRTLIAALQMAQVAYRKPPTASADRERGG